MPKTLLPFAVVVFVAANTHAGRWHSRDPIQEGAGFVQRDPMPGAQLFTEPRNEPYLYVFVANDSLNSIDPLGLWKVDRNGNDKAIAKPKNGDTVADLADLIGLNSADYRKWLSTVGPTRLPGSATEQIKQCAEFRIPNTVVAYWAGDVGWIGKWWVYWDRSIAYLRHLGFSVSESDHVAGQKYALEGILQTSGGNKKLQGLYFWGHGNAPYPATALVSGSGDTLLRFANANLAYKLGLGLVFSCDSNSGKSQLFSGSPGGIWNGYTGTLIPWWAYHVNIWIKPGDQETRTTPLLP